jgi:hypothetical protein
MSEEAEAIWEPKNIAILVPVLSSALAISWEVGRFTVVPGFFLFSLSEHLLAAMQALPLAFGVAALLTFTGAGLVAVMDRLAFRPSMSTQRRLALLLALALGITAGWSFEYYRNKTFDNSNIVIAILMLLFSANVVFYQHRVNSPIGRLFIFIGSIMMSLTLSGDLVRKSVRNAGKEPEKLVDVTTTTGRFQARLFMAGERGFLLYNPETQRFSFTKSDQMQSIEWRQ